MDKREEKMNSVLKKLFLNPATVIFLIINWFLGIGFGSAEAYLNVYLNEELQAS